MNKEGENDSSGFIELADFLRLGPTPASSDEVGFSAVNRRLASSNLARGPTCILSFMKLHSHDLLPEHHSVM